MAQTEDFVTDNTDLGAGRGRSSEEIRSEIDRTRAGMDETFAALDAKMTPGQIGLEAWRLFKGGSTAGAGKLWRIAKEHPMPAAVIGLGVGWLLVESARRGDGQAEDYGTYRAGYAGDYGFVDESYGSPGETGFEAESGGRLTAAKDKVKDVASSAKEAVSGAADTAREKLSDATDWTREHASDLGQRTKSRALALKGQAKAQTHRAKLGFWQSLEENPLLVGAVTLALGVIVGLAVPSTEKEDELLGETRDRLLDEVKEAGQEVLEKGKHVAEAVADRAKEEAKNQGLTPEGVVEKVKTVAREAATTAKEEAKNQNLTPEGVVNRARQAADNVRAGVHEEEPELAKR